MYNRFILSCCYFPQFNDHEFGGLAGGRIVRIATHPDFQWVRWLGFLARTFSRLFYPLLLCKACWNTLHCNTNCVTAERCGVTVLNLVPRLIRLLQMRRGRPRDQVTPGWPRLAKCAITMNAIAFTVSRMPFSCIDRTECRECVYSRVACWVALSFLPRVINFKFAPQPHQKYNITQYEEPGFS